MAGRLGGLRREAADEVDRAICPSSLRTGYLKVVRNTRTTESYALNTKLDRILNELDW